jgi:tripartite-type tricarboxylate transporter receptor subunit TctC
MKIFFFAFLTFILTSAVSARETVTLIYPWSMGDPMVNYSRTLIDEANQMQTQWLFVLENKPGAGGAIAAKHVASTANTVLAGSTAFFVRPNFFPKESHNISQFRVLMTQCAVPMMISSNRYKSWQEVPRDQHLNIGVSGMGATTHLIALQIQQRFPLLQPVPYKSTNASTLDLAGQRIDLNVGFPGEIEQWIAQGRLFGLGVTGSRSVNGIATLQSQGFQNLGDMVNGHSLIVARSVPEHTFQSWRKIFMEAAQKPSVQKSYAVDYCQPLVNNLQASELWFNNQTLFWQRMSQTVTIDLK